MGKIKLWHTSEDGRFYLVMWGSGYIELYQQYGQFLHREEMNWLDFTPIAVELEYSKAVGPNFTLDIVLLGLGLRLFYNAINKKAAEELDTWVREIMENQKEQGKIIEDLAVHKDAPAELRQRAAACIAKARKQAIDTPPLGQ